MKARASSAVIAFPINRVRPVSRDSGAGLGEVLIFSGVRIERMEEQQDAEQGHLLPPRPRRGRGQG